MIWTSNTNLWAVAGMVYALAGAVLLCHAVFLIPPPSRAGAPSHDAFALRRLNEQWLDTRIGVALLAVGFFLQATGTLGTSTMNGPAAIVLLGLGFAAAYYGLMRASIIESMIDADKSVAREAPLAQSASQATNGAQSASGGVQAEIAA